MAFKSTPTNSQNKWKDFNAYNTSYREKEGFQTFNKVTMSRIPKNGIAAVTDINLRGIDSEDNFNNKINTYSPLSIEIDALQYKKHERDDSLSDSSLQLLSSDNSVRSCKLESERLSSLSCFLY